MTLEIANISIAMPTTIDLAHIGLVLLVMVFFVLFLIKKGAQGGSDDSQAEENDTPPKTEPKPVTQLKESTPDAALQLLALLQQEARLIDFLKENLTGFSDEEIGAAARVVHEGGQKALDEYFMLVPVREEEEETQITLQQGFDASQVRLTGNVIGTPPFTGTLLHRGWKVTEVKLPKLAAEHDASIIAPAEVEL